MSASAMPCRRAPAIAWPSPARPTIWCSPLIAPCCCAVQHRRCRHLPGEHAMVVRVPASLTQRTALLGPGRRHRPGGGFRSAPQPHPAGPRRGLLECGHPWCEQRPHLTIEVRASFSQHGGVITVSDPGPGFDPTIAEFTKQESHRRRGLYLIRCCLRRCALDRPRQRLPDDLQAADLGRGQDPAALGGSARLDAKPARSDTRTGSSGKFVAERIATQRRHLNSPGPPESGPATVAASGAYTVLPRDPGPVACGASMTLSPGGVGAPSMPTNLALLQLRAWIAEKQLLPGGRLPAERELARGSGSPASSSVRCSPSSRPKA
jgi:hypothetical protein